MKNISIKKMQERWEKNRNLTKDERSDIISAFKEEFDETLSKPLVKSMDIEIVLDDINTKWCIINIITHYINGKAYSKKVKRPLSSIYDSNKTLSLLFSAILNDFAIQNLYARKTLPKEDLRKHGVVKIANGSMPEFNIASSHVFDYHKTTNTFWGKVTPISNTMDKLAYHVDFKVPKAPITHLEGRKTNAPCHKAKNTKNNIFSVPNFNKGLKRII